VSSFVSSLLSSTATRRHLNPRQAETVQRVIDAALLELHDVGFEAMTLRTVAVRASVAPATVYNYFSSKNHLVAEIFWRLIGKRPHTEATLPTAIARVSAVFGDLSDMLEGQPALGAAVTTALLGPEPDVRHLRELIGLEINRRIVEAAGVGVTSAHIDALSMAWSGAMLQAGMGHANYGQMGQRLADCAALILQGVA